MEYKESSLLSLHKHDTMSQYACPSTSQQNGRVEHKHQHILETIRTLLISSKVMNIYWVKQPLQLSLPSIDFQLQSFKTSHHELLHKTPQAYDFFVSWDVLVLFSYSLMNAQKVDLISVYVVFFVMELSIKDTDGGILSPEFLVMSLYGKTKFSILSLYFRYIILRPLFFIDASISLYSHKPEFDDTIYPPSSASSFNLDDQIEDPNAPSPPIPETSPQSLVPLNNPSLETWRSIRLRHIPSHLRNLYCYTTLLSYREPSSYNVTTRNLFRHCKPFPLIKPFVFQFFR